MSEKSNKPASKEFRESELASEVDVAKMHGSILRERSDPKDGYEPISLWLITLALGLMFWAGLYLAANSGGFRADVYNANLVAWGGAPGGGAAATGPPDPMVVGKKVFTQYCVVCHQATGEGIPGQFPPLAGSEWVLDGDWHGDNHLVKIVLNGIHGPLTVKGVSYNNAMAPWGAVLKDDQISAVLTYIRNEWGNNGGPISKEFVASIREKNAARTDSWTAEELQAIPAVKSDGGAAEPASGGAEGTAPAPAPAPAAPQ